METWQCLGFIVKQVKFHKEWLDLPRCHSALTAACLAKGIFVFAFSVEDGFIGDSAAAPL